MTQKITDEVLDNGDVKRVSRTTEDNGNYVEIGSIISAELYQKMSDDLHAQVDPIDANLEQVNVNVVKTTPPKLAQPQ